MGNLNKVMLIGRLTRDPEVTEFKNGGKVANLGFAVNNRRKNAQTGEWEEAPVWVNMKAYNHEHGRKLADLAAKLQKGRQVYVEGHLVLEQWDGKEDGKHHSKMLVYVDGIEFLGGGRPEGHAGEGAEHAAPPDHAPGEHVADAGWPEELPGPDGAAEAAPAPGKRGRKR
ncbi:MAG: single-stranded DNA-binding protein [Elusimicrobia bacterium]|nr:single-stranded DNA-binding protein [Elusimicrobiota bacterium]